MRNLLPIFGSGWLRGSSATKETKKHNTLRGAGGKLGDFGRRFIISTSFFFRLKHNHTEYVAQDCVHDVATILQFSI